jgi:uncharacterized RDD family membrane protein YckC
MIADNDLLAREPASIYRRLIATGVDAVVWIFIAFGGYLVSMMAIYELQSDRAASISLVALYLCMPTFFLTEVVARRTLGKRWAGITVVVLTNGKNRWRRWTRWAIKSSPWLMSVLYPLTGRLTENWRITGFIASTFPQLVERGVGFVASTLSELPGIEYLRIPWQATVVSIHLINLDLIPLSILTLGSLLYFTPSRRTLLDRLSGTAVYRWRPTAHGRGFEPLPLTAAAANVDRDQ